MKVSIITPAHNEAAILYKKIQNSLSLDYPLKEVIVVSDGSTDETPTILKQIDEPTFISKHKHDRQGKGVALNDGVQLAQGEILVISDARGLFDRDALNMLIAPFSDPTVGCVSGRVVIDEGLPATTQAIENDVGESESLYWRYESAIKIMESRIRSTVGVVGAIFAIRRDLYAAIPKHVINDDFFLALHVLKKGARVLYEPGAITRQRPVRSFQEDAKRRERINAGRWQILFSLTWWPWFDPWVLFVLFSHKVMRLFLPICFCGAISANAVAVFLPEVPPVLYWTMAAQVGALILGIWGYCTRGSQRRWKYLRIADFVANGYIGILLGMVNFCTGRHSVLWHRAAR